MSQQTDGLKPSDRLQVEEEGDGVRYNKPLDKTHNHAFVSSKSNTSSNIHHVNQSAFIDDDLVTWLQYPLDDGVACHDMLQHWPLPSPAPAPVLKDLSHHQQNDALMVDITSNDGSLTSVEHNQKTNAHLKQASHSEDRIMQEDLKHRVGEAQQHAPLFKHGNEAASAASGAALRQEGGDERQSVAKDSRKLLPQEDERAWPAKEACFITNCDTHSRQSEKRIMAGEGQDNNWVHTTQIRHQPQQQGPAYGNLPAHYNAIGSSSGITLQKEASVNSPCRTEESWPEKDMSRKSNATTDSSQAMNVQANPAADAALALGAGRAAGVIRPSGMEAFSKVRTSLQPIRPSKLGSPPAVYTLSPTSPSANYTSYPTGYYPPLLPLRGRAFGFRDSTPSSQPVQQTLHNAAQPHWFRPCASFPSMGSQDHQPMSPHIGGSNNSSKDSHLQSSTTALLGSQGTEELSVMLKQVPRAEQAKDIGVGSSAAALYGMDTLDLQKPSSLSLPYRDKKDDVVFSGGSETSESLKETLSCSKRKLDDSECQSEDAEGESAVNSQARSSSSKRTRANEVHNLSERRRRNRINDKMNALRELIPNATKSNKAALLDEAIDYLKNLQLQLQVMSLRTGLSLSPMVLPPGLPHMQMPQVSPIHPMGIGTTGGGAGSTVGVTMCDITYGVPARPLTSLNGSDPTMLQPSTNYSNMQPRVISAPESASLQLPHPSPLLSVNMDMCNTYLQQQQLQQHLHHQEHLASPQVQASLQPPPSSQQQLHYKL